MDVPHNTPPTQPLPGTPDHPIDIDSDPDQEEVVKTLKRSRAGKGPMFLDLVDDDEILDHLRKYHLTFLHQLRCNESYSDPRPSRLFPDDHRGQSSSEPGRDMSLVRQLPGEHHQEAKGVKKG